MVLLVERILVLVKEYQALDYVRQLAAGGFGSIYLQTVTVSSYLINDDLWREDRQHSDLMLEGSENCQAGCCDAARV